MTVMKRPSFHELDTILAARPLLLEEMCERLLQASACAEAGGGTLALEALGEGRHVPAALREEVGSGRALLLELSAAISLVRSGRAMLVDGDGQRRLMVPESVRSAGPTTEGENSTVAFEGSRIGFEGPIDRVMAGLVCRLSNSGVFSLAKVWAGGGCWSSRLGGVCWMQREGRALNLSFDAAVGRATRRYFAEFVMACLGRLASVSCLQRAIHVVCPHCSTPVTPTQVERRTLRGRTEMKCCVCDLELSLLDPLLDTGDEAGSIVAEMARCARARRDRQVASLTVMGKRAVADYDVWLCHRRNDAEAVARIGGWLEELGVLPLISEEPVDAPFGAVGVVLGVEAVGPWYEPDLDDALRECSQRLRILPIILPTCDDPPLPPAYVDEDLKVDFRFEVPNPMARLVEAISAAGRGPG